MTPGSAAVATKRSWTDRPDEPKNRLSMLLFFGMSALLLFVILIWSLGILWMQTEQKTFVATLSILRYGKGIPAPLYGVWDLGAMGKDLEKNGLKPWLPLINSAASKLDNKADVEATVAEWVDELKKKGALSKDTILIQLRCHAAVTREATDQWQCGLYIQDADDRPYPVGEFMQLLLKKIPVKNIVLVADVCDLKSAPHLGWIVNPIASYFMKACKELKSTPDGVGKNLWIICAADDAQAAYYSTLRKKTLFQEACEKGFEGFTAKQDLSLAAYFEAIYWHCHGSSGRHQTPRMIHANTGKDCFPSDQVSWQKANQVLLSQNQGKKGPKEADKDKKKDNDSSPKEKATEPKSANAERPADQDSIRLASMRQESEARTKDKPSTTEAGKSGKGEDKLDTEKLDTDERFRFWQLRDKISNRGDGVNGQMLNWSPNDFAPLLWRRLQSETASKDYDATFNRNELVKYEDNCNALSALAKALAEGVAVTQLEYSNQSQVDGFELCRTWNEFLKSKNRCIRN